MSNIINITVDTTEIVDEISVSVTEALQGDDGIGVPSGGVMNQVLSKTSDTSYDTSWKSFEQLYNASTIPKSLYGTGDPPSAGGLPDGTLYFQYI